MKMALASYSLLAPRSDDTGARTKRQDNEENKLRFKVKKVVGNFEICRDGC
jgi:hypothetical protein